MATSGSPWWPRKTIFAPIFVALAAIYASTHVPGAGWTHSFGLGGLFGDTVLGAVLSMLPVQAAFGLKVLSFVFAIAMLATGLFVLGCTRDEIRVFGGFPQPGAVHDLFYGLLGLGGLGVARAQPGRAQAAEKRELKRQVAEASAAAETVPVAEPRGAVRPYGQEPPLTRVLPGRGRGRAAIAEPIERHHLRRGAGGKRADAGNVLDDYGVKGEIVSVRPGPVVTMYELEPAPGLKASRVIGLADDIARSMSALSARVSTVPGRSVIGIELPNDNREKVCLREILSTRDFGDGTMRLPLALGKDIGGDPIVANLAKMPHLLIAGTTGSGKSVAINTMILSCSTS
jgi:hypothetical protein